MIKTVTNQIKEIATLKGITPEEAAKAVGYAWQAGEEYKVDNTRHENYVNAALREAKEKVASEALRAERLSTYHWVKEDGEWVVAGNFSENQSGDSIVVMKASGEKQEKVIERFTANGNVIVK